MRFVVNLTSPNVTTSLKGGNFRGEPRWERQVTEALLEAGHTVHTIMSGAWSPLETKPSNLIYGITPELASQCVCLAHDFQPNSVPPIFKASLFNMFSIHYFRDIPEKVQEYKNKYGRNLIFTQGYLGSNNERDIIKAVGSDHYEFLGVPGVPSVSMEDNFGKKKLLWISRGIHLHAFPEKENPELIHFINWVKSRMAADPELEFYIVSGLSQRDMDWQGWNCTVEERIFQSKIIQELNPYRNRVKVPVNLDWNEILDLMKNVKLSVSIAPDRWGGPPCEAAAWGIPYLQPDAPAMFEHMAGGYLHAGSIQDKLSMYTRLMDDHSFYREKGDQYRNFVNQHHTYTAFNKRLDEILKSRGIS
jgi:hypothetical protein